MNVDVQREGGNVLARVQGIVDGNNAADLQTALLDSLEEGDKSLVLEFGKLEYISSAGLRVLLLIAKELQKRSAGFAVCSVSGQVRELFSISGFDRIIAIHKNQADALASFGR